MIKISAETREMMVWLVNKFGDRSFTFEEISDTISPMMFEKFKHNKFVIRDDLCNIESRDSSDAKDWWRISWSDTGSVIGRKKRFRHME